MTPKLSIIVVSYNTRELTLACISSVFEQSTGGLFELLVIDNASTDESADAITTALPQVSLQRSETNLGFAGANNAAAERAEGKYLLLLNPDTEVLDAAVDKLVDFADSRPEAGIWGGRTLFADGTLNPSSCWNRMTPWSVFCQATGLSKAFPRVPLLNPEAVAAWWRGGPREVDIVSGCFFLIRRELWDRLGGFDPAFFMYGEEADLCLRARALGARPMVTPDAVIIHHGGASERVAEDRLVRLLDAKVRLIRRHWSRGSQRLGLCLIALWPLTRAAGCTLLSIARPELKERARVWRAVWSRRSTWLREAGDPHRIDATEGNA